MAERVFLHIGPYKTGTTFLQKVLHENRAMLQENGVCVPGKSDGEQLLAGAEIVGGRTREGRTGHAHWDAIAALAGAGAGPRAVISAEILCRASHRDVQRIVSSLQPAEVHVVLMARDPSKVIPGMWQTLLRNRDAVSWPTYLASVRGDADAPAVYGRRFWEIQDPRSVLPRWESRVPRERIHVVTVPPSGSAPSVLWERFCEVLGIDPAPYSLDVRRTNESLGTGESELLRLLNERLGRDISWTTYERWVKRLAARGVLERRDGQRRYALPEEEHAWLRPPAEEIGRFLQAEGYHVVGDLSELLPRVPTSPTVAPDASEPADAADAAVEVIAAVLRRLDRDGTGAGRGRLRSAAVAVRQVYRRLQRYARGRVGRRVLQRGRPRASSARSA